MRLRQALVSSVRLENQPALLRLNEQLRSFYRALDERYWDYAETHNESWSEATHPAHCRLRAQIEEHHSVVDFGCGSAHPAHNLGNPDRYLGVDWSDSQVARNRLRFPTARFLAADLYQTGLGADQCDWAVSFYVLEHCVWPTRLLAEMVRVVRPGGRVAVICPFFRPGRMNSMWEGSTARQSWREKLSHRDLADAALHALGQRVVSPVERRWRDRWGGGFQVLLHPRCLFLPPERWAPDTDAVYWTDRDEVERELARLGCAIELAAGDKPGSAAGSQLLVIARKAAL